MKRQITETEKEKIAARYRQPDGYVHCFIDNDKIENEKDIQYDHIVPYAKIEETSIDNVAPVCKKHNLAKKDMSLSEYRDKLQMEEFFKKYESEGK